MTSDGFLQMRLSPAEQQELEDDCLPDTRVKILQEARDWLKDCESARNILWIVGAPGAGKSTIATTLARELANKPPFLTKAPSFAKFFSKRDKPTLRDPGKIWRTLAYSLAAYSQAVDHNGVKAALMITLSEKNSHPRDDSVIDQFNSLIKWPLETAFVKTVFLLHKTNCPQVVIIIDALDECNSANVDRWHSLLDSLTRWTELPGIFKLVVTSRDHFDIRATLGNASCQIDLTTGGNVSDDSTNDIRKFFKMKFAEIRKKYPGLPSDWPSEAAMEEMTYYAAGLFIWADMVVKYVGQLTGGGIPNERLKRVLIDIQTHSGNQRDGEKALDGPRAVDRRVDRLYARVLFEAFKDSTPDERNNAKRILAAVVLAKVPLRKCDLVELLSTDTSDSEDVLASIESTLRVLSPIIPFPHADSDDELRVFHKTVSDFLLSYDGSAAAMKDVVQGWNLDQQQKKWDASVTDLILNCEEESRYLSLACVHMICRNLSLDIHSIVELLKQSNGPLDYAHQHWLEHLESSGGSRIAKLKCLADAMKLAYGCLQRYAPQMMLGEEAAVALTASLRDAADFASQCINRGLNGNLFCSSENTCLICRTLSYRALHC